MIQKIKAKLMILAAALMFALPAVMPAVATAQIREGLCSGAELETSGTARCGAADVGSFQATLERIVNILSIIIGVVAVIMIIFGGFRYITSGGDSTRVGNAKNTLIYAIIGLIIVALAQVIVRFVLNTTNDTVPG